MKWTDPYLEYKEDGDNLVCVVPDKLPDFNIQLPGENVKPVKVDPGDKIVVNKNGDVSLEQKPKKVSKKHASKSDKDEEGL